ncbi:MAG: tetratricopeptide repeat protein [Treponema sp.]|nr:tetratricopeptide repeat protein [Treponema sp.]
MKTFPLVYITIPEKLQKKIIGQEDFVFDSAIPLPVEIPSGIEESNVDFTDAKEHLDIKKIKQEMIFSGILQHLAENPDPPPRLTASERSGEGSPLASTNSNYYRNLIFTFKPAIVSELQEAAIIKAGNGDYETALEIFDLLFGLKGQDPYLLLNRALILEERAAALGKKLEKNVSRKEEKMYDEAAEATETAEAAYEKALANPAPDTLFYAALYYEKQADYSKAASCLESYLDISSEDELLDSENDKQIKAGELLAEIRKNGLDDMVFMEAVTLIRNCDEEKGIIKAKEFLERHPGAGRGWFVLGWGLRCLSRWDNAVECFRKALTLGCVNADTYNELSICLLETGDLAVAEKELEKALHLDPDNVKIISNMGILAMKQGNNEKAKAFFRTALELEPEDPVAGAFFGLSSGN